MPPLKRLLTAVTTGILRALRISRHNTLSDRGYPHHQCKKNDFCNSQGFVIPALAIALPLLLIILGFTATVIRQRVVSENLQSVVDITAKSAAMAACSSMECFKESRIVALHVVENHLHTTLNRDEERYTWQEGDTVVTIERGRWLQGRAFETFEGTWQENNPGIPVFSAYNAIKVKLVRNNITSILPSLLSGSLTSNAEAIAVARLPAADESVPPFAIPICSLLNQQGEYEKKRVCDADRLFTESTRYCPPSDPQCDIVPDFSYSPYSTEVASQDPSWFLRVYNNDTNVILNQSNIGEEVVGCSYFSQRYQPQAANFGVVGVPGGNDPIVEQDVENILNLNHGSKSGVKIGDTFAILDSGLTSTNSGTQMQRLQDNPLGDQSHYPTSGAVGWDFLNFTNLAMIGMPQYGGCDHPYITGIGRRPSQGVCRSTRNFWGNGDASQGNHWKKYFDQLGNPASSTPDRGLNSNMKVWKIRIPVIAERGASGRSCTDSSGANLYPSPSTRAGSTEYEIIGFISSYIYDSDIGEGPAVIPPQPSCASRNNPSNSEIVSVMDNTRIGYASCPWGVVLSQEDNIPNHPFGFRPDPAAPPRSCNVVRARFDCNASLFPSAEDRFENEPYLVN